MNDRIDGFVSQIRKRPKFVAASATDPKWIKELDQLEHLLHAVDQKAGHDPKTIEIYDKIVAVIGRSDLSLKERLLEVGKLLVQFRDAGRITH
jgi:hypothetical protein